MYSPALQCCRQHYLIALPGYHQAIDRHGLSTCNRAAELHISTLNYALNSISRAARVMLLLLLFSRLLFAQVLIALVRLCLPIYCLLLLLLLGGSIRIRCCTKEADGRCFLLLLLLHRQGTCCKLLQYVKTDARKFSIVLQVRKKLCNLKWNTQENCKLGLPDVYCVESVVYFKFMCMNWMCIYFMHYL